MSMEHSQRPRARWVRWLRGAAWLILGGLGVIVVATCWPYVLTPHYDFPQPAPFSGSHLWNPYATAQGRWWKANFHAHAHAWGGLTNGRWPGARVLRTYRKLGYDIACLSNYQKISGGTLADSDFIPDYEHGYNVWKVHELGIGARRVTWLDFPFGQTLSDKQYVIDRLRTAGGVVALAHPWLRNGYPFDQLRYLTGYTLMEVVRKGYAGTRRWDAALSAGHLSWIIADDDEHSLDMKHGVGVSWTMVKAASVSRANVLAALRAGHTYGVLGHGGVNDVLVREVVLRGDTLLVRTDPGARTFRFVGQNGTVRETVQDSMEARYVIQPGDTYVRTEIVTPHTRVFLNPIVRYSGAGPARPMATWDRVGTWERRGLLAACAIFLIAVPVAAVKRRKSRLRRS